MDCDWRKGTGSPSIWADRLAQHEVAVNRLALRIDLEARLGQPQLVPSTDLPFLRAIVMLEKEGGATVDVLVAVAAVADDHEDVATLSNKLLRALQIEGETVALLGVLVWWIAHH